jgi:hypothetical protein
MTPGARAQRTLDERDARIAGCALRLQGLQRQAQD